MASSFTDSGPDRGFDGPGFLKISGSGPVTSYISGKYKLGCVVRMVVGSILPDAESWPNDHRKDVPPFTVEKMIFVTDERRNK